MKYKNIENFASFWINWLFNTNFAKKRKIFVIWLSLLVTSSTASPTWFESLLPISTLSVLILAFIQIYLIHILATEFTFAAYMLPLNTMRIDIKLIFYSIYVNIWHYIYSLWYMIIWSHISSLYIAIRHRIYNRILCYTYNSDSFI